MSEVDPTRICPGCGWMFGVTGACCCSMAGTGAQTASKKGADFTALEEAIGADMAIDALTDKLADLQSSLGKIIDWADAYPLDVFREPSKEDWATAARVLKKAGLTLDAISGSNMRHCLEGAKRIAAAALAASKTRTT